MDTEHLGLTSYRFIPPPNAMGSHTDPDPVKNNPDNSCFCLKDKGFQCFKSGVFNMAPCKVTPDLPKGAPIALSYPHFYEADQSFLDAVVGLKPNKTEHQFYVDVVPEFGFPLAIRPRFQLNAIIRKHEDIDIMRFDIVTISFFVMIMFVLATLWMSLSSHSCGPKMDLVNLLRRWLQPSSLGWLLLQRSQVLGEVACL